MTMRVASAQAQAISAERAAGFVRSGMWLDYGTSLCQPDVFDRALGARIQEVTNVKIRHCLTMRPRAVLDADPEGRHVHGFSLHYSGYDRRQHDCGRCNYIPVNLGEIPDYYRRFIDPVDIVILKTCPIDEGGYFNLSAANLWHRAIVERARMVIVETNRSLPYVYGEQTGVHVSEVDYVIEGDDAPAPELPNPPPGEIDAAVGRLIAAEIDDGACLQIGIGGMPNAVCSLLVDSGVRDLGVHTEMMTDGMADLYKTGRITGARKTLNPGKIVYTFALGSRDLYATLDRNRDMHCCPVDYTNPPHVIMQNDHVISINNTTQVDLQGQVASESDGHRHLSGTGGQLQFVRGAYASKGGKSFICLSSTYDKRGERRSRIVLNLTQGNVVTTPRSDVMFVVTEYGMVNLKGKSVAERAKALVGIAHPDCREGLERQAYEHRLIPRGLSLRRVVDVGDTHTLGGTQMTPNATTQTETLLLTETKDGVATLTLNRPGQFNALSSALIDELQTTFDGLAADPTVSVVVLAANGRGFCAGHDLKEIRAMGDVREVESLFARCSRMMMTITTLPQPVIARVHGIATAAGCQLVATCDLAVASAAARFATPGVNIGAFCYTPSVALGRAVGRKHAMEMLLTGETISAERAYQIGLVNRVVSPETLDAEVETLARSIASKSSAVIASGKQVFYRQLELSLGDAYGMAGHAIACDFFTDDGKEGVDAFLGKRAPRWKKQAAEKRSLK